MTRIYFHNLDTLRTVAALMVFVTHLPLVVADPVYGAMLRQGTKGVNLFFVLSGFLITTLLLVEHANCAQISLTNFYRRRILRLFPLYYSFLTAILLTTYLTGHPNAPYQRFFVYYSTYLGNFDRIFYDLATVKNFPGAAVLWTLGIEEQFYLLAPLCLALAVPRGGTTKLLGFFYALTIAYKFYVVYTYSDYSLAYRTLRFSPFSAFDSILMGCLLGALTHAYPRKANALADKMSMRMVPLAISGVIGLGVLYNALRNAYLQIFGEQLENILFAAAILVVCYSARGSVASSRPSIRISNAFGKVSYGFYLFHVPCIIMATSLLSSAWQIGALSLLFSTCLAALSYRYLETPFLNLKRRYSHD